MALFEDAINTALAHECGYVNDASDLGSATNWGVSLRSLKQAGHNLNFYQDGNMDADDVRLMPRQNAIRVYRERFWRRIYNDFVSQAVVTKLFDTCVNAGHTTAHRIYQRRR